MITKVHIFTDNMTAKSVINKGSCTNPVIMTYMTQLCWYQTCYSFSVKDFHVAGKLNYLEDSISRLHESKHCINLSNLLWNYKLGIVPFSVNELMNHMSWSFIHYRWPRLGEAPRQGCG